MKNIHLLPINSEQDIKSPIIWKFLYLDEYRYSVHKEHRKEFGFNMYITSDEDILRGQWYFSESLNMVLQYTQDELLSPRELKENGDKKIIITTDWDLINDGVQAIDDKFAEWFCKNSNCEEVEVQKWFDGVDFLEYRIVIPEQDKWEQLRGAGLDQPLTHWNEPKQNELDTINYDDELINNEKDDKTLNHILTSHMIPQEYFSKKETLEEDATSYELAKSLFEEFYGYDPQIIEGNRQHELIVAALQKGIVYGANLQAKKMYSEVEVLKLLLNSEEYTSSFNGRTDLKHWFEQFKKK